MTDTSTPTASTPRGTEALPRPRIRTGAVIWGLLLVALAGTALWVALVPSRREAVVAAVTGLDGFGWTVVAVVTAGGIMTLVALAAVIRAGQHRLAKRDR